MSTTHCLLLIALSACGNSAPSSPAPTPAPGSAVAADAAVATAPRTSEVHVDRRLELIAIVMRLAKAEEYVQAPATPYVADVDRAFAPFANHAAVATAKKLRNDKGIAFDAPMSLAIHLDDQLQPIAVDDLVANDERFRGVDVAGYARELRDFAAASKLDEFLAAHADYTRRVEDAFRKRLDAANAVPWFDGLFGARRNARYVIVPGLLTGGNNYGPRLATADKLEMYQVLGLYDVDRAGIPKVDDATVELLVHEMAHSYINPIFDKHRDAFAKARDVIYPLVEHPMREQNYGAHAMIDESGVRAVTTLYARDHGGAQAAADATRREVRRYFLWTSELETLFRRYRDDRAHYPDLEAFMPQVLAFFDGLAAKYAKGLPPTPFLGPLDAVLYSDHVLVTVKDPALAAYVQKIHDRFFTTKPLLTASDRTLADNRGKGVVAYGTAQSNPVVATFLDAAHVQLGPDKLVFGSKTFTGPGLILIACRFRSDDPAFGLRIYAAARDADLVNVNSIRHGPQDWVVARTTPKGFQVLASGDFPHAVDGAWLLP